GPGRPGTRHSDDRRPVVYLELYGPGPPEVDLLQNRRARAARARGSDVRAGCLRTPRTRPSLDRPTRSDAPPFTPSQTRELAYLHSRNVTFATFCQGPYDDSVRDRDPPSSAGHDRGTRCAAPPEAAPFADVSRAISVNDVAGRIQP